MGGNFTQYGAFDIDFYKHQPTLIKLGEEAESNIAEPYSANSNCPFTEFEGVVIQNLQFQGNYIPETSDPQNYHGIYLPDSQAGEKRSNLTLIDVMIFDVNGIGFYGGTNQSEYSMRNILTRKNREHGFVIQGQDNSFHKVASGENGLYGFHLIGGGAHRIIEMDAWGNKKGIVIENSIDDTFVKLNTDLNIEEGVWIKNSGDLTFTACTFKRNSKIYGGSYTKEYSNVKLEGNAGGYGPYAVRFIGCKIGESNYGGVTIPNAKYGIEDTSTYPNPNQIISSTFKTLDFELGNVNETILKNYTITDCLAWGNFGDEEFRKKLIQLSVVSTIELGIEYQIYILRPEVETNLLHNAQAIVYLPSGSNLYQGFCIKIFREKNEDYDLVVKPHEGNGTINGLGNFLFSSNEDDYLSADFIFWQRDNGFDTWLRK